MVGGGKRALGALVLVLALAALAACGEADDEPSGPTATPAAPIGGKLAVRATEWAFEPASIVLTAGEPVQFLFQNDGEILHDFKIRDIPLDSVSSESPGPIEADEGEALVSADSGESGTLDLVPSEPGTYEFYCTIQGHEARGMRGTVTVVAE